MNLIIDEDEVRILNQVNYNADSFWRQYDSNFENAIEIDYHTFTLKNYTFYQNLKNNFETGFQHFGNSFSPTGKRR